MSALENTEPMTPSTQTKSVLRRKVLNETRVSSLTPLPGRTTEPSTSSRLRPSIVARAVG